MRTTFNVWDGRELDYLASDVRISFTTHAKGGATASGSDVSLSWEEAWKLYDQLRYLLHDSEVREQMIVDGQIDRHTAYMIANN